MPAPEFDLIETYFAPLAAEGEGGFGLTNDAALLPRLDTGRLVTSVDSLLEGVHFLPGTSAASLAVKALAVNLSDLAAMGARPHSYLLALSLPGPPDENWLTAFTTGLRRMQEQHGIFLLGGDTTSTPGPLSLSITIFGALPGDLALTRSGARPGDLLYLSGSLGDAALGLLAAKGELAWLSPEARSALVARYEEPTPRVALGEALLERGLASAAMDVSDGLLQDLGHLARHSGLGASVERSSLPLSPAARSALAGQDALWANLVAGGDDYELLFTVPPAHEASMASLSADLDLPLTRIGVMETGDAVRLLAPDGLPMALERTGWSHF